jgi:Zn-dependent M28 family amino/carboxypeptidase
MASYTHSTRVLFIILAGVLLTAADKGAPMDNTEYLRSVVVTLSREIGVRSYRDIGQLEKTAKYISDQFASFGYPVTRQPFPFGGNTYHNVIAELRGRTEPEKILVVGAHYDTVRTTPGADDNASGVAGLLGIAKLLAGKPLGKTVRFVAFGFEEPPAYRTRNMGSYHYARSLKEAKEQVEGMICLEMIGFFSDRKGSQHYPFPFMNLKYPREANYIALVGNLRSKGFTTRVAESFRKATDLSVITLNAPAIVIGIDFSDHWSFNKFGFKALMVTDTAFYRNPNYHAPSDLPETLDYERMAKVVEGLAAAVEEWGRQKTGR